MTHEPTKSRDSNVERGHASEAIWPGVVALCGVGLMTLIILAMIGTWTAFHWLVPGPPLTDAGVAWRAQNRLPGVEPNQAYGREELLAEEQAFLRQYAWLDKERAVAHIPIERGIELMAQREMKIAWPINARSADENSESTEAAK